MFPGAPVAATPGTGVLGAGAAVVLVVGAAELLDVGVGPVAEPLLEHPDSVTTATEATAAATVSERTKATTKTSSGDDAS
ncbi:MAG: hypothetical protein ABI251_02410 [Mycobacteriaceae bacterium]